MWELNPYLPYRNGHWPNSCRNFTKLSRSNKYITWRLHVTSRQDARSLLNVKYKQIQKMKLKREKSWDQYSLKYLSYQTWQVGCSPIKMICCEWMIPNSFLLHFIFHSWTWIIFYWYDPCCRDSGLASFHRQCHVQDFCILPSEGTGWHRQDFQRTLIPN